MTLKYNTSLKYGPGHDAPWLTVESDNEEELHAALASLAAPDSDFFAVLGRAIGAFKTGGVLGEVLGAQVIPPGQSAPPAYGQSQPAGGFTAPPAAPQGGGEAKYCSHGLRNFKSGTNRQGKAYSGYFCTANQCPPEWG